MSAGAQPPAAKSSSAMPARRRLPAAATFILRRNADSDLPTHSGSIPTGSVDDSAISSPACIPSQEDQPSPRDRSSALFGLLQLSQRTASRGEALAATGVFVSERFKNGQRKGGNQPPPLLERLYRRNSTEKGEDLSEDDPPSPVSSGFTVGSSVTESSKSVDDLLKSKQYKRKPKSHQRRSGAFLTKSEFVEMTHHLADNQRDRDGRRGLFRKRAITGAELVDWLIEHGYALDVKEAEYLGDAMLRRRIIFDMRKEPTFDPTSATIYRLTF